MHSDLIDSVSSEISLSKVIPRISQNLTNANISEPQKSKENKRSHIFTRIPDINHDPLSMTSIRSSQNHDPKAKNKEILSQILFTTITVNEQGKPFTVMVKSATTTAAMRVSDTEDAPFGFISQLWKGRLA